MKIALAYDSWNDFTPQGPMPDDFGAEFDEENTIETLLSAIESTGHDAMRLPIDGDLPERLKTNRPHMVFNIAEGTRGSSRESLVPAWLEHAHIPYTGADGLALGCTLDKALAKHIARSHDVRTPGFHVVEELSELESFSLSYPVFAKPNAEGSSMGIRHNSLIEGDAELHERVEWILDHYHQHCLIEEFAPGREFCVGLLGNNNLETLPIVEIQASRNFYAYEDKSAHAKELTCPADIPEILKDEMIDMGHKVFRALRCRDLARVDFKLDKNDRPTFLEVNPLPGLSPDYSIFPCQARAAGYSYDELIHKIINAAMERNDLS